MSSHLYSGNGEVETGEALVSCASLVVHSFFFPFKIKLCGLVFFYPKGWTQTELKDEVKLLKVQSSDCLLASSGWLWN